MKYFILLLITLISNFLISYLLNRFLIYIQKKHHDGQAINKYLISTHQEKKKTPTMGGSAIILSIFITSFMNIEYYFDMRFLTSIIILISFSLIGIIDDILKIKKNYIGLSASIRFLLEFLISCLTFYFLNSFYVMDNSFYLSKIFNIDFGILSMMIFALFIVGSSNAMNLTDGLDALAGGLTLIMLFPFILLSIINKDDAILFLLISIYGSVLGFLINNINPAKIFMGDSGSLPLGAIFALIAYFLKNEFLLALVGGLLVIETISVIMQVTSFKLFHKRIFLMTPFHHHLELKGKSENSIVILYYVICITLSLICICLELFVR